mmetsp:Transcript_57998/g.115123  ORF Transcript_57998/g.115123 Transcript_57998/m.115123 type:complete len:248 (-) Transcript_57998:784-1527(-)
MRENAHEAAINRWPHHAIFSMCARSAASSRSFSVELGSRPAIARYQSSSCSGPFAAKSRVRSLKTIEKQSQSWSFLTPCVLKKEDDLAPCSSAVASCSLASDLHSLVFGSPHRMRSAAPSLSSVTRTHRGLDLPSRLLYLTSCAPACTAKMRACRGLVLTAASISAAEPADRSLTLPSFSFMQPLMARSHSSFSSAVSASHVYPLPPLSTIAKAYGWSSVLGSDWTRAPSCSMILPLSTNPLSPELA